MDKNLGGLEKLLKVINTDNIVTPAEIEQVLAGILELLTRFKKDNDDLNTETKETVDTLFNKVVEEQVKLENKINEQVGNTQADINSAVEEKLSETLKEVQRFVEECKALMPQDGKNADPADVVPLVMAQIKLPEYKETVLDGGEEIVEKINDLPTDDDKKKIDIKHIKGLKEAVKEHSPKGNSAFVTRGQVLAYDLSASLDGSTKTFSLPAFDRVIMITSTSFPYTFRPTVDYTVDHATMQITFTSEVTAGSTLSAGQTLLVLYTTL